jgi:flagellin
LRDGEAGAAPRAGGEERGGGGLSLPAGLSVATPQGALDALAALGSCLRQVAELRGTADSAPSRPEGANPAPRSSLANSQAPEYWIRDAAAAEEAAGLARRSILQDPGAAVLAQANVPPAVVLHLLC